MKERTGKFNVRWLLVWCIMVCAGVLIKTRAVDDIFGCVYRGVYGDTGKKAAERVYRGGDIEPDMYSYMSYWEDQVMETCVEEQNSEPQADGGEAAQPGDNGNGQSGDGGGVAGEKTDGKTEDVKSAESSAGNTPDEADPEKNADAARTVTAMADITSSYIDMDADTLLSYCYNAAYPKCVKSDELDASNLLGQDLTLDMSTGGYKVLIYHTHSSEAFADSRTGEVEDTVIGLGNRLAEILTDTYGISVYHDTTEYDMMTGVLDRNASYDYSREGVYQILQDNPEIEVMIDLHRDGVPEDTHLVTDVDGKPTAQIMLINGMCRDEEGNDVDYWSNDNKVDNMAFALQTYLAGRGNYGDIMRKIYISTSRYNMDLMPHAMLAEIGAQTNTVEEEYNAVEPFAAMLAKVLLK